ncbi:class D beta-lactamase [Compostibacter hankyongensis]|uniref:beta-lactamase n=1 Tax=Compostibacter hankyongensis TaxID=1007089 RepID=A0ABP8G513_9BACT
MKIHRRLLGFVCCGLLLAACSPNRIHQREEWGKYFSANGVTGSFMLYNNASGDFDVYNLKDIQQRSSPASTFKIMNALTGLETGVISDTNMVIPWDGVPRQVPEWNQDLSMGNAFRYSAVPYYQEVARRIGRKTMQQWLDSVKYGNMIIGPHIDSFWLDNSLQLSPDEELGFIKQLYFSKLPFQERSQRLVREVMLMEQTSGYKLSYKTGWETRVGDSSRQNGWLVGWEEENKHVYFFVLHLEGPPDRKDFGAVRFKIFHAIMEKEGFFKGQK